MFNEQDLRYKLFTSINSADKSFAEQYGLSTDMKHWWDELKAAVMQFNQSYGTNYCPLNSVNEYIRKQNEFLNSNEGLKLAQELVDKAMRQSHCKSIH
ncbi:hypothetical protein [Vibrio cholerae]|uniref:hypothetical protein n=1 Tax=Vibrio cholerae TaxID=666 RepID=UPI0030807C94